MAGLDRPSPAGGDAVPSLSRRKRGRPGRWTSQLLLLRPRPSAWPVTSSNKLRPAASGVTAPSPGLRTSPFPPIRSGISAPPPSWPPRPAISSAGPSFSAFFVGLTVVFFRQAVIFVHFCWLSGRNCPPGHHFRPFLLAQRSFLSADPSFSAFFVSLAVIFFRQPIIFGLFCRLDGQFLPSGHRIRLLLSVWWTANDLHM